MKALEMNWSKVVTSLTTQAQEQTAKKQATVADVLLCLAQALHTGLERKDVDVSTNVDVYTELTISANILPTSEEAPQKFLLRLVTIVDKFNSNHFHSLSRNSRTWMNAAVAAIKAQQPITLPHGYPIKKEESNADTYTA